MPALNKTNIAKNYHFRGYLSVIGEAVVIEGEISAVLAYPTLELIYTLTSGSTSNVKQDMEIEVYSAAGALKGRLRVAPGTVTSTSLPVNEFSRGRLELEIGDTFRVLNSYRVRDRLIANTAAFDRDSRVAFTEQFFNNAPLANAGGLWCGWAADATAIPFDASGSQNIDPDSSGTFTCFWAFGASASPTASTSQTPTVNFSSAAGGTYVVQLTVSDSDNTKSSVKHVPVRIHTDADPPLDVTEVQLTGDVTQGWRATFTMASDVLLDDVPDGAQIVYWEEEYYDETKASYGSSAAGRSHMKFVGYFLRDSIQIDYEQGILTFEAASPLEILRQIPGFSQAFLSSPSPTSWQQIKTLTINRVLIELLRWNTTVLVQHDLILPSVTQPYPELFLQAQTPAEQAQELASALDCVVTCDRLGRIRVRRLQDMVETADREDLPVTMTLTPDEILSIDLTREHRYIYSQLDGRGFSTTGSPLFSRAPGEAPSEAPQKTEVERLIVTSQDDLNARTGRRYALENHLLNFQPAPEGIPIVLPDSFDVFDPSYEDWIVLEGVESPREGTLSNYRCTLQSVNVNINAEDGTKDVQLTVNRETDGPPGATVIPAQDSLGDYTEIVVEIPPFAFEEEPTYEEYPDIGDVPVKLITSGFAAGEIARSTDFDYLTGAATLTNIGTGVTGNIIMMDYDVYNPRRYYALTTTGLWRCDDVWATTPVWEHVATNTQMFGSSGVNGHYFELGRRRRNFAIVCAADSYTIAVCSNLNSTSPSWSNSDIVAGSSPGSGFNGCYVAISPFGIAGATWVWAACWDEVNVKLQIKLNKSSGLGTWTLVEEFGVNATGDYPHIYVPYTKMRGARNSQNSRQRAAAFSVEESSPAIFRQVTTIEENATYFIVGVSNQRFPAQSKKVAWFYPRDGRYVSYIVTQDSGADKSFLFTHEQSLTFADATFEVPGARLADKSIGNISGWGSNRNILLNWSPGQDTLDDANNGFLRCTADGGDTWNSITVPFADNKVTSAIMDISDYVTGG
jgi:hypothetical protein